MTTRALPTPATSAAAFPTPLTTNSQASAALSRLLPNNAVATPYQRSHVTPDLKPGNSIVGGSGIPQLHPGPTPYSMPSQRPT